MFHLEKIQKLRRHTFLEPSSDAGHPNLQGENRNVSKALLFLETGAGMESAATLWTCPPVATFNLLLSLCPQALILKKLKLTGSLKTYKTF